MGAQDYAGSNEEICWTSQITLYVNTFPLPHSE